MPFNDFESELRASLRRQPAPASLKAKVMAQRGQGGAVLQFGRTPSRRRNRMVWLERIAASLVVASVVGGAAIGHFAAERRKGEEAKQQVFTALRITNHALGHVSAQLAAHDNKE